MLATTLDLKALLLGTLLVLALSSSEPRELAAQPGPPAMPAGRVVLQPLRDGARDFDFLLGSWTLSYRGYAAAGSPADNRIEEGRVTVRRVAPGQVVADYEVVRADRGKISGLELMLYDPTMKQWAVYDARSDSGRLEPPAYGHFDGTDGRFFAEREVGGRRLPVRISWTTRGLEQITWEWAYSLDGGATWHEYWRMDLTRSGPAPGERVRTAPNDAGAAAASATARRIRSCCHVVESFRYVVPAGNESALTKLFNDEATLLGDSGGVHDIALLRDLDRPNTYLWLRGFYSDDAVRRFAATPVWSAHRQTLDRTAITIDSAYSLRAGLYTSGFTLGERLTQRAAAGSAGIVVATIYTFDSSRYEGPLWVPSLVPIMAAAGGRPLAVFETHGWAVEAPAANGERTTGFSSRAPPTRSRMVAVFTWLPDSTAYDGYVAALDRDPQYRDMIARTIERNLAAPIAVWRLVPLAGSHAFRWSWEAN